MRLGLLLRDDLVGLAGFESLKLALYGSLPLVAVSLALAERIDGRFWNFQMKGILVLLEDRSARRRCEAPEAIG